MRKGIAGSAENLELFDIAPDQKIGHGIDGAIKKDKPKRKDKKPRIIYDDKRHTICRCGAALGSIGFATLSGDIVCHNCIVEDL